MIYWTKMDHGFVVVKCLNFYLIKWYLNWSPIVTLYLETWDPLCRIRYWHQCGILELINYQLNFWQQFRNLTSLVPGLNRNWKTKQHFGILFLLYLCSLHNFVAYMWNRKSRFLTTQTNLQILLHRQWIFVEPFNALLLVHVNPSRGIVDLFFFFEEIKFHGFARVERPFYNKKQDIFLMQLA